MSNRVGLNLRVSAYLHQGDRKYMEDEFQVAYQRSHDKKDIEYAFFGIFDGHGGKEAAHFAKDNLMDNIVSQRLFWSDKDEDVLCAIKEGFIQTHMAMWKELDRWPRTASGWPSTSGTTASIAFVRRQKIYIGHVGDSRIVLGCDCKGEDEWSGISLTRDHKPDSLMEINRINECGGKVIAKSGVPRVVWNRPKSGHQGPVRRSTPMDEIPFLAVARSLGDLWSYNASNNQFVVSPEPDVDVIDIDINHHRCLIFGTDGLWNVLSPTTAVNIAYNSEKNNEKHYLGVPLVCGKQRLWINPSRCIVSGALEIYQVVSVRADNTSAVTVYLDPPGKPKREVLLQQLSLKKGAQSKNSPTKSPSKKPKDGAVKTHMYNQVGNSEESNKDMMGLKGRLPPEEKPSRNNATVSPSVFQQQQQQQHSWANNLPPSSFSSAPTKEDNHESSSNEENSNASSDCSECGCVNRSSPSSSGNVASQTSPSSNLIESCHKVSSNCNNSGSTSSSSCVNSSRTNGEVDSGSAKTNLGSKSDVAKISLVHNSTYVRYSNNVRGNKDNEGYHTNLKEAKLAEVSTSAFKTTPRLTRSCTSHSSQASSENKRGAIHIASSSKIPMQPSSTYSTDTSHRVLKNVNRSSSCLKTNPSSSCLISSKRKRSKDLLHQEERSSKSLRVHTRSHTMKSKPMITRSQGKPKVDRRSL